MFKLIKRGKDYDTPIKKFICNNYEDASQITESIPFGSVLYVTTTSTYYIYNSENKWIPQNGSVDYV